MKKKRENVFKDFKKFINRGNIIDLATGIIIGAAFTSVVNSLVNDIIMPLISRIINFDLTSAKVVLKEAVTEMKDGEEVILEKAITLNYGTFIQYVINFFIIAFAIYVIIFVIKTIRNGYIKSEIKYVKKLKKAHPELFDEEDEFGTRLYERLKNDHPEYFQLEINKEIEEQKAKAIEKTPQEITNDLLAKLNDNIEKLNSKLEDKEEK